MPKDLPPVLTMAASQRTHEEWCAWARLMGKEVESLNAQVARLKAEKVRSAGLLDFVTDLANGWVGNVQPRAELELRRRRNA